MNVSLYQAAAAMNASTRWQEVIADNLASGSVPGFKRQDVSFDAVQAGLMSAPGLSSPTGPQHFTLPHDRTAVNFAPGQIRPTGVDTDVALDGPGFFEVRLPNGSLAYTRAGEFRVSDQGELVTKQGYVVMGEGGPIQLDRNAHGPLNISDTGQVSQGSLVRGKIKLVSFDDPQLLASMGGAYFQALDPALQPADATNCSIRQRFLEGSNTTPMTEMVNLMAAMRSYEVNQRLIQVNDERMGMAIRDLAGTS